MSDALIITGMHRSGTSLLASLIQRGGVHIGDRLLPALPDNPHGFFEDEDFVLFHGEMLVRRGGGVMVGRTFAAAVTEPEVARAAELIAARAHLPLWGWKDPRTSLFLDLWHGLLPEARYLFVYRNPLDVLLSLVRRREPFMAGLLEAVEAWYAYNARVLQFVRAHPGRCLLVHIEAAVADVERLVALSASRLAVRLALMPGDVAAIYMPAELRRQDLAGVVEELAGIHPDAVALYRELEHCADMPSRGDVAWPKPPAGETLLPSVRRRLALIGLCVRLAPEETERFFARSGHDLIDLKHYARSLEVGTARAEAYARSLEERAARAEAYARSLEELRLQSLPAPTPEIPS
ncbi:MAG: hypothetical protein RLZZ387_1580 [Chloroflexota bacterium]